MTFAVVPDEWFGPEGFRREIVAPHASLLDPTACQRAYGCDAHLAPVNHLLPAMHAAHAWAALYGHTKDDRWKGFFEIPLSDAPAEIEAHALALLDEADDGG